jgi:hypothetical protein
MRCLYMFDVQGPVASEDRSWGIYGVRSRYKSTISEDAANREGIRRAVVSFKVGKWITAA